MICEFLGCEDLDDIKLNTVNNQRVILVAAHFRREVTSTVLWLMSHGLQIQCFKTSIFDYQGNLIFNVEQVLPTKEASDFVMGLQAKEAVEKQERTKARKSNEHRKAFWNVVYEKLEENGVTIFQNVNQNGDTWLSASSGFTSSRYHMFYTKKQIRAYLGIYNQNIEKCNSIFDSLVEHKNTIEEMYGDKLNWIRGDDLKHSKIEVCLDVDATNIDNWEKIGYWLADSLGFVA